MHLTTPILFVGTSLKGVCTQFIMCFYNVAERIPKIGNMLTLSSALLFQRKIVYAEKMMCLLFFFCCYTLNLKYEYLKLIAIIALYIVQILYANETK